LQSSPQFLLAEPFLDSKLSQIGPWNPVLALVSSF
jgi:hypothetical protein